MFKRFLTVAALLGSAGAAAAQAPENTPAKPPEKAAKPGPLTRDGGQPVGDDQNSRTAGENGPALLDNLHLLQKLARFDRERTPERVVHARGVGVHGEFVSYGDQSKFTKAKLFAAKDKATPVFVRFSTVIHPKGSPEQLRDPRGFSVKFYTEEGNWDLVGNNLPVFFIRDAIKFPDVIHALKPSPVTNQQDPNRFFDFFSLTPEATNMLTYLYSDMGTPNNLRQMDGFGVHAFKWVNEAGDVTYVKFNWRSMQGLKTNTKQEAMAAAGQNQSGLTKDLYDTIQAGQHPSWELKVQMMKPDELSKFDFDPLDDTKIWPGVEEVAVGKMTLNRVPDNFFQFTEQSAFSPSMMPPGIEASEDKMLQGRLFSYGDTQRHRIGANYLMLPVNRPSVTVDNVNQDGHMNFGVTAGDVNYQPSRKTGGLRDSESKELTKAPLSGSVVQKTIDKTQNFKQAGELYQSFDETMRANLVSNLAGDLNKVTDRKVKVVMVSFFARANEEFGGKLAKAADVSMDDVKACVEDDKK